jgi:hypothetical protein
MNNYYRVINGLFHTVLNGITNLAAFKSANNTN